VELTMILCVELILTFFIVFEIYSNLKLKFVVFEFKIDFYYFLSFSHIFLDEWLCNPKFYREMNKV